MALAQAGGTDAAGGGADALLQQIRQLLDQYLAMGNDTPVAQEAMALAEAIDTVGGAGAPAGPGAGPPADQGAAGPGPPPAGMPPGTEQPLDQLLPQPGEPPASTSKKSFGEANKSATDRLKKRNAKA